MPETGALHAMDSSKTGFLYKCPFRLNEGEFQRASFVSKNLKGREIKKRRIQMKEMKKNGREEEGMRN